MMHTFYKKCSTLRRMRTAAHQPRAAQFRRAVLHTFYKKCAESRSERIVAVDGGVIGGADGMLHTFYKKCAGGRGARLSRASTRSTWRGVDRRRQQSRSRSNSHSNSLQTLILQAFRAFFPTSTSTSNFNFFSAPPCAITGKNDIIYGMNLSLSRIRALPRSLASCIPARVQCPVASNHHTLTVFGLTTGI